LEAAEVRMVRGAFLVAALVSAGCVGPQRPLSSAEKGAREAREAAAREAAALARESREEAESEELEMGPPPPGYWRITAEPVPGWVPQAGAPDGPGAWLPLGPRPITGEYWSGSANASGRVVSIAVQPGAPSTAYIATASGGIWKTTNGGTNWSPLTDELSILNHGAVAIDPSNTSTIYAGTGEYTTSSGGDGLFRSLDAGGTWSRIATTAQVGSNISRVAVDPSDSQRIFVSGNAGLARTIDGGGSWSFRVSGSCSDLAINPANPQIVYAARHSDGVYRSLDGGATFAKLTGGLPSSGMRRIVLAIAPGNPAVLYAAFADAFSGLLGLYKTVDGGVLWMQLTATPNFPSPQSWYDMCLAVDPASENNVWAGGVFPSYAVAGVIKSTNGGASWTDVTVGSLGGQVHPDIQTLAFGGDGVVWVGCDGGVWKSTTAGLSWTNCNATLMATQNYQISLHPTDPARVIGGTQDNGTVNRTSSDPWPQILSGDGGFSAYDFTNTSRRYVTYVNLTVYRQFSGTTEISGPWGGEPREFIAPLVMDPGNARRLLGGTNRIWQTTNADSSPPTWTPISDASVWAGANMTSIAVAPGAAGTIYAGSTNGRVGVTTDSSTWFDRSGGLSGAPVSDIVISPTTPGTAYASFASTSGVRLARADAYGTSWTNVTGTLPAGVRAKALAVDWRVYPPMLWVGSGAGVYSSADHGATWVKDGADLPNVNVGDLQIDRVNSTITAGTYGRGAWRATLPTPPCFANCDGSVAPPVLNVADFTCFLQRFGAGEAWANCDGSVAPPALNVADFTCFLQKYAAGCP
jgi:photosystem II stability/assembly factor-like uncharacterized protein